MSSNQIPEPAGIAPELRPRALAIVERATLTDPPALLDQREREQLLGHVEAAYGRWTSLVGPKAQIALNEAGPRDAFEAGEAYAAFERLLADLYPQVDPTDRAALFAVESDRFNGQDPRRRAVAHDQVLAGPELGSAGCGTCGSTLEWDHDDVVCTSYAACCGTEYSARAIAVVVTRKEIRRG